MLFIMISTAVDADENIPGNAALEFNINCPEVSLCFRESCRRQEPATIVRVALDSDTVSC